MKCRATRRRLSIGKVCCLLTALPLLALTASPATADTIGFDPTGGSSYSTVGVFDFLPGNSLFRNINSLTVDKTDVAVPHYVQARLGTLLDGNNDVIDTPGLDSTYELTVVVNFDSRTTVSSLTALYSLDPSAVNKYFRIYYDDNPLTKANDLTGTGFDDGTLILDGTLASADGVISLLDGTTQTGFDQFGADDYAGKQTLIAFGGLDAGINVTYADPSFFGVLPPYLAMTLYNQSEITPFDQVDPSQVFLNNTLNYAPVLGGLNGTGQDFQVQSDSNSNFIVTDNIVPEPSTIVLSIFGLAALVGVKVRSRRA